MQLQANTKRRDVEFKEGDLVYLKLRPYRQQSLAKRRFEKLAARFYGPYKILKRVGKVAYTLELPSDAQIHPTFHVSQLRAAHGIPGKPTEIPSQLTKELELLVQPEALKGVRGKVGSSTNELEVLIQWQGLSETEATWEDFTKMQFPTFNLGDKVKVWPGGIVMPPALRVYSRRSKTGHSSPSPNN